MKHINTVSALALAASMGFAGQASANTRLLVNCFWPSSHFVCSEILPAWIAEVERVTEGRVRGNIPPRSVAPPPEQLAAVVGGVADVSISFNGFIEEAIGARVAMMPFVAIRNAERMSQALWATNRQFFPDEITSVHLLSQFVIGAAELYSQTDTPINSIEDLASRRMWVLPSPLARIAAQIGSGVVSTPAVESNEIISRGVVDGHLGLDPQDVRSFQLLPYTRSTTRLSHPIYSTSFSVFINNDTWAEISPEDQQAIMSVSGDVLGEALGARWDIAEAEGIAAYADAGVEVIDADPAFEAALVEASRFVTADWLTSAAAHGIDAQAALDFYKAQLSGDAN